MHEEDDGCWRPNTHSERCLKHTPGVKCINSPSHEFSNSEKWTGSRTQILSPRHFASDILTYFRVLLVSYLSPGGSSFWGRAWQWRVVSPAAPAQGAQVGTTQLSCRTQASPASNRYIILCTSDSVGGSNIELIGPIGNKMCRCSTLTLWIDRIRYNKHIETCDRVPGHSRTK